ncbi:hypothetical protein [Variovorax sp. N23]|nr:hypothetical protein [Variovorax sp. N23]MCU4119347.1 hypothetical protein [Variovorax sp. N23]
MTFLDRITSAYRFLTQEQRAMFEPCRSEQAVRRIAARMGAKLPGNV